MDLQFTQDILILNLISFFIYLGYLELNPKITGIWLRRDSNNNFFIALSSLWNYVLYPFKEIKLWYPNMWDLNIFISVPLTTGLLYGIRRYYYYLINK